MTSKLFAALKSLASEILQSESELSDLVSERLTRCGIEFSREKWLNDTDRIDYLVGRIGVELKLKGPVSSVTRQLARYADSDLVDEVVLVTTRATHKRVPGALRGKPITVIHVGGWL